MRSAFISAVSMTVVALATLGCGSVTRDGDNSSRGGRSSAGGGAQDSGGASASTSGGSNTASDTGGALSAGGGRLGTGGSAAGSGSSFGTGGSNTGGSAGAGTAGGGAVAPAYAPRTGSFRMLAYSIAKLYKHASIEAGQKMLQDIGKEQGFEVTAVVDTPNDPSDNPNEDINAAGLAKYEIVFFMNPSGDVFNDAERAAFEDWMTTKNGAFAGVHSATDTESGWSFYKELTGQYNGPHDVCCPEAGIQWQPEALDFVAVAGLPNPWLRREEWFRFDEYQDWSSKAGFKILSLVTTSTGGTRPVSYIREWGNFRSFYTSIGHESAAFEDADVKRHIAAGIMWAVRREALFKQN